MANGSDPEGKLGGLEELTRYDPAQVEQRVMSEWLDAGYFHPDATGTAGESFSVVIPPPNVTGALHMGHALNGAVQDAIVRVRRMQGTNTLWLLGTDHAGIATQAVVQKEIEATGSSLEELGRDAFVERVWQWKEQYGSTIVEQYERLGASCDYERERFTLDERYVRAVYKVFKALYDRGFIYRDNYMVNWDPGARSAISDLEVEYRDVEDTLYHVSYPLASGDGEIVVATVRPETILADTAIAVHPEDERYAKVVGSEAILPLVGRRLKIITDEYVDPEFGSGAVKITPGHDPNDFEIGRRHGLEEISAIGEDGRMTQAAGEPFTGLTAAEARAAVVAALEEEGRIVKSEPYVHSVGHSHRSGEPIEPLISLQWFCRMDELAKPAIEAVEQGRVRFVPERWARVYLDWMRNIRPWCISRQLWWGHRLPVWYCDKCEETFVGEQPPERCGSCDDVLRQESDVLDTWFSSALWPFAALGWPDDTPELRAFYPTDFLTTAREIIFLWVSRMVMMGLEFAGDVPFEDVYVHSVILAPDGRRMSKSLGTGIDPLEAIEKHGADALRFGLLAMSSAQDVRYSAEKVQQGQDLANKLWNASRLILMNAADVEPAPIAAELEDRWIISRLQHAIRETTQRVDRYDFAHAALGLYRFFWNDLCDWYLEAVKPRLYDQDRKQKADVSATLLWVLGETLALLHPVMPFVTEAIYAHLPEGARSTRHLAVRGFPEFDGDLVDDDLERRFEAAQALTTSVREFKDNVNAPPGLVVSGSFEPHPALKGAAVAATADVIQHMGRIDLRVGPASGEALTTLTGSIGTLSIDPHPEIDASQVARRLDDRRAELEREIDRAEGKLANQGFVEKAPAEVVGTEREKLERYRSELAQLG